MLSVLFLAGVAGARDRGGAEQPAAPAAAVDPLAAEVVRGWYLWRTGQDEAAAALASELAAAHPESLAVAELHAAMAVVAGDGASLEAELRERWGEDPADPLRRVALALALALRHPAQDPDAKRGAWCDEVSALVGKVVDGEPHYWATLADRQRERRCVGDTDHADAELNRIRQAGGVGWADGVLGRMEAGYIKTEMPDELVRVWTEQPYRVDRAGALWREDVSGPAKAAARKVARQALDAAVASSDPVLVHAAMMGHLGAGDDKAAEAARARLASLDPKADPSLVRSVDDVADPSIYAEIDACVRTLPDPASSLTCIGKLSIPERGAIAAYTAYQRRLLDEAMNRRADAYAEAKAAHQADPAVRFHARAFARLALEASADAVPTFSPADLELAVAAATVALGGRDAAVGAAAPGAGDGLTDRLRPVVARDLELRGRLLLAMGKPEEALADLRRVRLLSPTPAHQILVGLALAGAGHGDEAALELARGLAVEEQDTELISRARDALRPLAEGWVPDGVRGMIAAARRAPGVAAGGDPHPLVGQRLADAALLPSPDPAQDPAGAAKAKRDPGIRVIAAWAVWSPESAEALTRVAAIAAKYADRNVRAVALGVDAEEQTFPDTGTPLEHRHAGPSAMRALRSVALPAVVVVDARGTVIAALAPYDRRSLDLETALDGSLPKP